MLAGDNIHTARHIARECGIFTDGGIAMEGPVFREMPWNEIKDILPRLQARSIRPRMTVVARPIAQHPAKYLSDMCCVLQVLARSAPKDKQVLVNYLKELGEVRAGCADFKSKRAACERSSLT